MLRDHDIWCGSGSGSIPLTNGSGSGSRRPKNMWVRWIQIRIRIRNTALKTSTGKKSGKPLMKYMKTWNTDKCNKGWIVPLLSVAERYSWKENSLCSRSDYSWLWNPLLFYGLWSGFKGLITNSAIFWIIKKLWNVLYSCLREGSVHIRGGFIT